MRKGEIGKEPEDRRKQESAEKHRDETKKHEEQIHAITAVVTAVDRIATEHQANRDQRDRQERESRQLERRTLCGIWTAAFFALLAVTVTHCDTRDLITDTREIADRQHKDTLKALA